MYYYDFQMRMVSGNTKSVWHKLENGIITGCTILATLFAMNMLIKAAEIECSGLRHPPICSYMDDMTIMTTSVIRAKWLLKGIKKLITWARMSFNATKSRSLVLKKGKLSDDRFKLSVEYIPTIKDKPAKSLGKHLKDVVAIQETGDRLKRWLNKIDRSGLLGRFKAWIYQHVVLPKILWPLTITNSHPTIRNLELILFSSCSKLEKRINSRLRRWLGLPKCLSSVALYGNSNTVQLPFKSLVEEYKVTKVRTTIQFKYSKDSKIAGASIEVYT